MRRLAFLLFVTSGSLLVPGSSFGGETPMLECPSGIRTVGGFVKRSKRVGAVLRVAIV